MPETVPYIDIHTHRPSHAADVVSIFNLGLEQLRYYPSLPRYCSIGRHPWDANEPWSEEQAHELERALDLPECLALGEVGLDRVKGPDIGLQRTLLVEQLDAAVASGRPVILHCVRAHADLLQLRKQRADTTPWIMHGFTGHGELAQQLLRMGFSLSFGAALLSTGAKVREALTHVPLDRMFFETDESEADVRAVYRGAADVLGFPEAELRRTVFNNFQRCFGGER
ncbi:MAG: TatD family hydrolase [Bacteroidetes bacterium]|nr:TatD family hydrolase [Bacteroidota bacterium]